MDATETPAEYRFTFDVAGLRRLDLQVRVDGGTVSLSGARTTVQREETALRVGRPSGAFVWRLTLPQNARMERTSATLRDGVLQLRVPKQPSPFGVRGGQESDGEHNP